MKKSFILFILILFNICIFADWIEIPENSQKKLFESISSNIETTEIQFSLNGYDCELISEKNEVYHKISYKNANKLSESLSIGEGEFLEIGKPALPRFSRLIAIPNKGEVSVEIINIEDEILYDMNIFPRQQLQIESQPQIKTFIKDEKFYSSEEVFPQNVVEIGTPAIMRDFRVVNVTVNPFQYDPQSKELRLIKNIDIAVNCFGKSGDNIKINKKKRSRFFESLYKSAILNYDSTCLRGEEFQQPCYLYIYPDNSQVESNLQYLVDWKHQKGFDVVAASTQETGTTLYSIKNYVQDAYDNWENPPEFICIIGDAGGGFNIPTGYMGGGEGDQYYVLLEGSDILADAFIGRLSFNSIYEFQTIIFKILNYEKEPYLGQTEWYNRALLVGDPTTSGQSCVDTKQHVGEMINVTAPNMECVEVYYGSWVTQIASNINNGVSYFNYRGYYGMSGWTNSNINQLNNGFMLPMAVFLTCGVGSFQGTSDCRSERFLKVGSPGSPKGAIGAIATATTSTHTCFNNCVDGGIYYGIFADEVFHMGGALNRGKLSLYVNYPNNPMNAVNNFSYWNNLMGDPGMELWTGIPEELNVLYDSEVSLGSNYIEITVENSNCVPIEDAWVTALMGNDDIFSTGYTDSNGKIILQIGTNNTGSVNLTVTKHNFIPHLGTFDIIQEDIFVNIFEIEIDDDNIGNSSGNEDGFINPGEDIELNVSLMNFGTQTANSITAVISSETDIITITDSTEDYGDIPPGFSVSSSDNFDFSVSSDALGGAEIQINLLIEDEDNNQWHDILYLTVEGANLYADDYSIIDGNNGILDPGETSELVVTIKNIGSVDANGVNGTLTCSNNKIEIDDSLGYFGNILAGNQATNNSDRFELTANAQLIPGSQIVLNLQLFNSDGYNGTTNFILEVGEVSVTDPLGPDEYGYYCYDDGDTDYYNVPSYQWVEIDPTYGGPGTIITLYDNGEMGDIEDIDLPINFRFYGKNYSSLTVCSNGWITPGNTGIRSFMNWSIPGPLGPSPIIAPFWDDLKMGGGHVCYYYDQTLQYFIVEWSHLQNAYNNAEETFQVILYDSYYYPASNGDSEILFQYETINNVDWGSYGGWYVNHGEFATIGIEDYTSLIGLEYTYCNQYPIAAKTLENEMAILFTGPPISPEEPFIVLGGVVVDDENGNGNIDYGEDINLEITLNNLGESTATDVYGILCSSDNFITITSDSANYNNIPGGGFEVNLTDFSFSVSGSCPDEYIIPFELYITSNEDNWEFVFVKEVYAPEISVQYVDITNDDNSNGILDPGETANLVVSLQNTGHASVTNIISTLVTGDEFVIINNSTGSIPILNVNTNETVTFNVSVAEDAPIGHSIIFNINITADNDFTIDINFPITVGLCLEDFETGGFLTYPWEFDGNNDWAIVTQNPYEGIYCAKSGSISNNQTSELILDLMVYSGTISFYRKVSSQPNGDYLKFYIDDVLQDQWSGTYSWSEKTYQVTTSGNHTFKWSYEKNSYGSSGSDCVWIDYITFPAIVPLYPIFYLNPLSIDFGSILVGEDSTAQFTIHNFGGGTLIGNITTPDGYSVGEGSGMPSENQLSYEIPWSQSVIYDLTFAPTIAQSYNNTVEITSNGSQSFINHLVVNGTGNVLVNVDETNFPSETKLYGSFPNPFSIRDRNSYAGYPEIAISFGIKENSRVILEVYNIMGQKIKTLIDSDMIAGNHSIIWNGMDDDQIAVASGIYFYCIKIDNRILDIKKLLLIE